MLKSKKKVAILKGGPSPEKEISIKTGNQVIKALKANYKVESITVSNNIKELINQLIEFKPDVVFNALHGCFGEDGQIQSILNSLKIPYTHSGTLASSVGMNKYISKIIFEGIGIQCPKGKKIKVKNLKKEITIPSIVKPINGGSSIGITKIFDKNQLTDDIITYNNSDEEILIEDFIPGREITVGVLNNAVCGITEIITQSDLYDYTSKYIKVAKHVQSPILPVTILEKLKKNAEMAHNILGCNCISRSDFRYDDKNETIYLLEINTQPGLTNSSLLPEMAMAKGINFFKLCQILIDNARCENL